MGRIGNLYLWIIVALVVIGGGVYWWYAQRTGVAPAAPAQTTSSQNTQPTLASGSGTSDSDLNADLSGIDTDMSSVNSDTAAIDTSMNDQPVSQAQ